MDDSFQHGEFGTIVAAPFTLGPYESAIYARLDPDRGWCRQQFAEILTDLPDPHAFEAERRWLAIDWLRSAPIDLGERVPVGHFRSREQPEYFLVFAVTSCRGLHQPARLVVAVHERDYELLGFDPFRAFDAGLFEFGRAFRASPAPGACEPASAQPASRLSHPVSSSLDALAAGDLELVRASELTGELEQRMRRDIDCLSASRRSRLTIGSFLFAERAMLALAAPVFGAHFDPSSTAHAGDAPAPDCEALTLRANVASDSPAEARSRWSKPAAAAVESPAARTPPVDPPVARRGVPSSRQRTARAPRFRAERGRAPWFWAVIALGLALEAALVAALAIQ